MKVLDIGLIVSAVSSLGWSLLQVILGNPVSPWSCLLLAASTLLGFVAWLREEARADRWMKRALDAERRTSRVVTIAPGSTEPAEVVAKQVAKTLRHHTGGL